MKTIAFAQQKGGVGKSTLAISLAVELEKRGKRVAIVDVDQQGTVSNWRARRQQERPVVMSAEAAKLPEILDDLAGQKIEFALLDLPGIKSPIVNMGMKAADLVIVPSRPSDVDLEASVETVRAAQRMGKAYVFALCIARSGSPRTREFAEGLAKQGQTVLPVFISQLQAFPDATGEGLGVPEYEPKGKAAAEVAGFTNAVLERLKK